MKQSFSLALGGGGARGLAHIGVIRRLEELELKPRAIAGTSMGAIVGALLAIGKTSYDMEELIAGVNFLSLVDLDMTHGLLKGKKIETLLEKILEGKTFADTLIPLQIIATDINSGERVILKEGKLSVAVRASIGLPGIFIPRNLDDHALVDGGLTNNLPVEVLPDGPVIAISALRDLTRKIQKSRKIFSFEFKKTIFGNSYSVLQKTIDIMLSQNESRSLLSREGITYIRPTFDKLDYYEFHKYKEFIRAGYEKGKDIGEGIV